MICQIYHDSIYENCCISREYSYATINTIMKFRIIIRTKGITLFIKSAIICRKQNTRS